MEEELDIEINVELGDLPKGWEWTTLGNVCHKPQYGWTTKADKEKGKIKLLRTTDITSGEIEWSTVPFCTEVPDDLDKYLLEAGDIVISRAGSVGVSYLLSNVEPAVFASYLIRFRPKAQVDEKYIAYYLQSPIYWEAIGASKSGIALFNVNAKKLGLVPFPLAPLPQQRRIVSAIELQLGRLDAAVARLHAAKAKLKRYKQAVLKAAVEDVEGNWTSTTLGDVAKWGSGATPKRSIAAYFGGTIPWLKTGELGPKWVLETEEHITEKAVKETAVKLHPKGSVAIAMYGATIGKTSILGIDVTSNQACAVGQPKKEVITSEYLYHFLLAQRDALVAMGVGGAQPNISQAMIKEYPIQLPSLAEQSAIVDKLEQVIEATDGLESTLDAQLVQAGRLRQAVLKRAFEGRLV